MRMRSLWKESTCSWETVSPMFISISQKESIPGFEREILIVAAHLNLEWMQGYPGRNLQNIFEGLLQWDMGMDGCYREKSRAVVRRQDCARRWSFSIFITPLLFFPFGWWCNWMRTSHCTWCSRILLFWINVPFCEISNLLNFSHL